MHLKNLVLIGFLFLAYAYALDDVTNNDQGIGLLDVADQGADHANYGDREAREVDEESKEKTFRYWIIRLWIG